MTAEQKREIAWDAKYYLQEAKILLETIGEVDLAGLVEATEAFVDTREKELGEQAEAEYAAMVDELRSDYERNVI